jgi:CO/xanthine dehydrogenase FAD-binding subunit
MSYHRPATLESALDCLASQGPVVLAGATDLYPVAVGTRMRTPVLDISGIAGLRGIETGADWIRIGACTTWAEIRDARLTPAFDALRAAAAEVGGVQIQNAGTIAGNLCNASPAADGVPPLMVLDAEVEIAGPGGRRRLPLADFLTGARHTALRPDELVVAILVPRHAVAGRSVFRKLGARRHLVISIAMVAVRLEIEAEYVRHAALAVGACGPVARRLPAVEARLADAPADAGLPERILTADVAAALDPIDDLRASAAYRVEAAVLLLRRAALALVE